MTSTELPTQQGQQPMFDTARYVRDLETEVEAKALLVDQIVDLAMATEGVDQTSPGYHNAGFVAHRVAEILVPHLSRTQAVTLNGIIQEQREQQ